MNKEQELTSAEEKMHEEKVISDIYNGDWWYIWKDNDSVFISIANVTISLPLEEWESIKEDFMQIP